MSRLLPGNAEPPRTDTHTQRTIHENITVTHMPAHRTQKTESRPQTPQAQEHRHSSCCRSSTHIRFRCRVQGRLPHPLAQAAAANHPLPNDGSVHYGAWESRTHTAAHKVKTTAPPYNHFMLPRTRCGNVDSTVTRTLHNQVGHWGVTKTASQITIQ